MKRPSAGGRPGRLFFLLFWFGVGAPGGAVCWWVGMGAALAGARFGFTTGWRQLIEQRDPQGVIGQVLLLAWPAWRRMPLLGQFSELQAALGPPSVSLLVGAFVFGLTMQIADGCGSGTLYKAGMGVPLNMGILPLFALGSFLGSVHLDRWLALGQTAAGGPGGPVGRGHWRWPPPGLGCWPWPGRARLGAGLAQGLAQPLRWAGARWRWRCWRR
jgi:uncharacterized membrane protein YedE/YeeE